MELDKTSVAIILGAGAALVVYALASVKIAQKADTPALLSDDPATRPGASRGIRNRNPGNIEYRDANQWLGQVGTDGRFAVFSDHHYGLRAMARILHNDLAAGKATIAELVNEWAPPIENDTGAYIAHVASFTGIDPDVPLRRSQVPVVMAAMVKHENGYQPYPMAVIEAAERAA